MDFIGFGRRSRIDFFLQKTAQGTHPGAVFQSQQQSAVEALVYQRVNNRRIRQC